MKDYAKSVKNYQEELVSNFFYNQPIAHRFGRALISSIESGEWKRIEIAVAWVRQSGTRHAIITASARGIINTMKVELPEIKPMTDPVVRLERTPTAIVYQTFDANSVLGRPIMDALIKGQEFVPPVMFLTKPQDPHHSTW